MRVAPSNLVRQTLPLLSGTPGSVPAGRPLQPSRASRAREFLPGLVKSHGPWIGVFVLASGILVAGDSGPGSASADSGLPSVVPSLARVLGAFTLVLGVFFGAVWVVRHWRRIVPRTAAASELRVMEVRSLGVRQNLLVVAYRDQRMLLASTPAGVTFLSHLGESVDPSTVRRRSESFGVPGPEDVSGGVDFVGTFREALAKRS